MGAVITKICVGGATKVSHNDEEILTGIFKSPIQQQVAVSELGLEGDTQVDLRFHGGRDKAIYVYPEAHYYYWQRELEQTELEVSQFGENLNVNEVDDKSVVIGDRYQLGTAVVEVTQPRIPCFKLGIRLNDNNFPARFLNAGRLGFYLRVEQTGQLQAGNGFDLLQRGGSGITVFDLWRATFTADGDSQIVQQALDSLPYLDEGWRKRLVRRAQG